MTMDKFIAVSSTQCNKMVILTSVILFK